MATPSTNGADPGKGSKADPRRLRWSVPAVDVSTNRWLDMQNDISHSLQLLIRESIQRDGYIDVVNRPIEQLPRRGRPPQGEPLDDGNDGGDEQSEPSTQAQQDAAEAQPAPVDAAPVENEPETTEPDPTDEADEQAPANEQSPPAQPGKSGLDAFLTS